MSLNVLEISPDTRALASRLAQVPHGETVPYAELSAAIGRDVRLCRHLIYSAFNLVRKEVGAVFGVVRGEGYQRLTVDQVPHIGSTARRHIRRTARQASKRISASLAKANDVPNEVRLKANTELSVLGLVEHMSRDKNVKPSDDMNTAPQPVAIAAKAFLERIGGS
jgi:hypothetical protein